MKYKEGQYVQVQLWNTTGKRRVRCRAFVGEIIKIAYAPTIPQRSNWYQNDWQVEHPDVCKYRMLVRDTSALTKYTIWVWQYEVKKLR